MSYKFVNNKIIKNIYSVSGIQIVNYLLPLVVVPYVVRVIGPDKFGLINFALAFIGYFTLIINYGFELTATREIASRKNDAKFLSNIFWTILFTKCILFIVSTIVFAIILLSSVKLQSDPGLYILAYLYNIGIVLFPTWFYQGIEELSKAAIFSLLIKIIFTVLIFLSIHQVSDYYYYPICLSVGQISIGLFALWYAIRIKNLSKPKVSVNRIIVALKDSTMIFITTVVINLYTLSNIVLLGFLASDAEVGYYSSAYKLITVILAITIAPITQTLYPHLSNAFSDVSKGKSEKSYILLKIALLMGSITLFVSISIFIIAPIAVNILFGENFAPAILSLRMMSFLPFIIGLSNVFGIQGMLNLKLDKEYFKLTAAGAIICIILNFILIPHLFQIGTAISWVLTEIFISITTWVVLRHNGYIIFTKINIRKIFNSYTL